MHKIYHADSFQKIKDIEDNSIDLIITSPPYAQQRKSQYDGISEDKYVEWFLIIAKDFKRILKDSGSFFLNIKPHTKNGERLLYVFDLVKSLKTDLQFYFVDEYAWIKNAFPGNFIGRFKNGFEPIYHFTKSHPSEIIFNPLACGTPIKEETIKRSFRKQCAAPKNGSKMTTSVKNMQDLSLARPSNVIILNNISNQFLDRKDHPAPFPEKLVEFFIKSFTNENSLVLDPFAGSGTVGLVCLKLNRDFILIEKEKKYIDLIYKQIIKLDLNYKTKKLF